MFGVGEVIKVQFTIQLLNIMSAMDTGVQGGWCQSIECLSMEFISYRGDIDLPDNFPIQQKDMLYAKTTRLIVEWESYQPVTKVI